MHTYIIVHLDHTQKQDTPCIQRVKWRHRQAETSDGSPWHVTWTRQHTSGLIGDDVIDHVTASSAPTRNKIITPCIDDDDNDDNNNRRGLGVGLRIEGGLIGAGTMIHNSDDRLEWHGHALPAVCLASLRHIAALWVVQCTSRRAAWCLADCWINVSTISSDSAPANNRLNWHGAPAENIIHDVLQNTISEHRL